MRRAGLVASLAAALVAVGSAGALGLTRSPAPNDPAKAKLTAQQIGARRLLAEYAKTGGCSCTAATRARDRVKSGLVKKVEAESAGSAASP